jgi:hypothetical protein
LLAQGGVSGLGDWVPALEAEPVLLEARDRQPGRPAGVVFRGHRARPPG